MNVPRLASATAAILMALSLHALAQAPPPPPVDPAPPPLPDFSGNAEAEPQVTIIRGDAEVREEVRMRGELRYIRVTPRGGGRPYYLIPDGNGNTYIRRDSLDPALKVPMWVLFSF